MKWYWVKTSAFVKLLLPGYVWDIRSACKTVCLTFDDGPVPDVTESVLDILKQHGIKATFFVIGKNVAARPDLFQRIITEGHSVGNHTYNHLNGWSINSLDYIADVELCDEAMNAAAERSLPTTAKLFRPPYGKIRTRQARILKSMGYKIIMWDILTADFDRRISARQCLLNATARTESGSILIFHDSVKAKENMLFALPRTIEYLKGKGFGFDVIR